METKLLTPIFRIKIDGQDITEDLTGFAVSATYRDTTEPHADNLDVMFTAEDDRFAGDWYPPKGSKLEMVMGYPGNTVSSGIFDIDEVEYSGMPYQVSMRAIAAIVTKGLRTKRSTRYEDVTLRDIVLDVARRHGMQALGEIDTSLRIPRCMQNRETDISFLNRLAQKYGCCFSARNETLYFSDIYELEATDPVTTVSIRDVSKFNFRDETMKVKRAATTKYVNPDSESIGEGLSTRPEYRVKSYRPSPLNPFHDPALRTRYYLEEVEEPEVQPVSGVNQAFLARRGFLTPFTTETNLIRGRGLEQPPEPEPEAVPPAAFQPIQSATPYTRDYYRLNFTDDISFVKHFPPDPAGADADEDVMFGGARSQAEADAMAKAANHRNTTGQITGTLSLQGRPSLVSGSSILLAGFGKQWDGKYFVTQSTHNISSSTYSTQIEVKKI